MDQRPATPGYNSHLEVWFKNDKAGRPRAYFFSTRAGRVMPIARADAELAVAQGLATKIAGNPFTSVFA